MNSPTSASMSETVSENASDSVQNHSGQCSNQKQEKSNFESMRKFPSWCLNKKASFVVEVLEKLILELNDRSNTGSVRIELQKKLRNHLRDHFTSFILISPTLGPLAQMIITNTLEVLKCWTLKGSVGPARSAVCVLCLNGIFLETFGSVWEDHWNHKLQQTTCKKSRYSRCERWKSC